MTATRMHLLYHGKMWLDRANVVAGCHLATSDNRHPEAEWTSIPVTSFLIEHPDGLIQFDTGCDPLGMSGRWPESSRRISPFEAAEGGALEERLDALGVRPGDVRYVVMSHLHTDHAGRLSLFRNAEVFASEREFTQTLKLYALGEARPAYSPSDIGDFLAAKLKWHLLEEGEREYPLAGGVTILNFGPGHTFGMLGLLVELPGSGNFLLVSDALYTRENAGPPPKLSGLVYDSLGYLATAAQIQRYARLHHAEIIYGHDTEQCAALMGTANGCLA